MCKSHFAPVQCIIPPYINDKLVESTNKDIAANAVNTKFRSYRFRSDREFFKNTNDAEKSILCAIPNRSKATETARLEVYDCQNAASITNAKLLWENENKSLPADQDATNVIQAADATWKFYYELFGRNSIDNLGMIIQQYIHYDREYDNAFWDGRRMIYGDGDGKIFGSFTSDIDIIGHELTHGVTQYEANLDYHVQAGALNESFSDIFGVMIKQRVLNEDAKTSDWLIGENVLIGEEYALRSLKAPGTAYKNHPEIGSDPQPATMDEYINLPDTNSGDWGGVHYNSGIPNFAFYVTAFNMGGFSWEKAGRIWYSALTDRALAQDASFSDLRKLTVSIAEKLYGTKSLESKAVKDGWNAAKVK
jgi:Zn-dependent metalloprotease